MISKPFLYSKSSGGVLGAIIAIVNYSEKPGMKMP
jgi:hypothetical protein